MTFQQVERIERAIRVGLYIEAKVSFYRSKWEKARKQENRQYYWHKYNLYHDFLDRAFHLVLNLRNPQKFGVPKFRLLTKTPEQYRRQEAERIAKGKAKFENLHEFEPWFFGTGLHQDYGTFTCSNCKREFFHSPSRIKKAGKIIYNCACGHCTNDIINRDYNSQPYE